MLFEKKYGDGKDSLKVKSAMEVTSALRADTDSLMLKMLNRKEDIYMKEIWTRLF